MANDTLFHVTALCVSAQGLICVCPDEYQTGASQGCIKGSALPWIPLKVNYTGMDIWLPVL